MHSIAGVPGLRLYSRLTLFTNFALKSLGRDTNPWKAASDVTVVAPEEEEAADPVYVLPGQIERATASVPGFSTLDEEIAILRRDSCVHSPVTRYVWTNALVHGAGFDSPSASFRQRGFRLKDVPAGGVAHIPRALYCNSSFSHQYFGHWLQDACVTALMKAPDQALLLDRRPDWLHVASYLDALQLDPATHHAVHIDELTVYQDYGHGSHKRARYAEMRRRLEKRFPTTPDKTGCAIYFRRGRSGSARIVAAEDDLIEMLARDGFECLDLAGSSVEHLYSRLRNAAIVVSMDGSHLNHLYFAMRPASLLITLVPADRFTMNQIGYAQAARLKYGFVVAQPVKNGYEINSEEIMRTIDLAIS